MVPHLNNRELDLVRRWSAAMTPSQIQAKLAAQREKKGIEPVGDAAIRRAVRGHTFRRRYPKTRSVLTNGRADAARNYLRSCVPRAGSRAWFHHGPLTVLPRSYHGLISGRTSGLIRVCVPYLGYSCCIIENKDCMLYCIANMKTQMVLRFP